MKNSSKANPKELFKGNKQVDIQDACVEILKTMTTYEKPQGLRNNVRILSGDPTVGEDWQALEGFGYFKDHAWGICRNHFSVMINLGLIEATDKFAQTIKPSVQGMAFLEKPTETMVWASKIRYNRGRAQLEVTLRRIRDEFATETGQPPYKIIPGYTMDRLLWELPDTEAKLRKIPGMDLFRADNLGVEILQAIADHIHEKEEIKAKMASGEPFERVSSPIQEERAAVVSRYFKEGWNVGEIAREMELKESTIYNYLEKLHQEGVIDMRPWIEENVDSKVLYKGAEFFRQAETPELKAAFQVLGIDYNTLKLCRLYVAEHRREEMQIAV
ncbi:MAG: helix-turn-helix domain-containing protein [Bacteroidia bacterium]|nr:helix-turn-helix domain-containing protein [Bacteroidia bacterium]